MSDTLNPALEAALPRPIRLHHPKEAAQADLFSRARRLRQIGSFGYECADFLEDIAAYLAAASPQAEIDRLRETGHHKSDNDRQVFFYEQDFYVLSNFSAFNLKWGNLTFPTSEHAYHWEKFCFSGEMRTLRPLREEIRTAPSAHEAFKIAERNKGQRRPDWDRVKLTLMKRILRAKADQHEYVCRKLLATGDRELIEDSWRDDFWGWGPNRDGQNMLGKLWMDVRADLRALRPETPNGGQNA